MISDKTKMFCLIVFTLTASGCGGGGGNEISDPQILLDGAINTDSTTTPEVTVSTETSDSFATPVVSVSSAQMDNYVGNPLVITIPSELMSSNSDAISRSYITNPLIN